MNMMTNNYYVVGRYNIDKTIKLCVTANGKSVFKRRCTTMDEYAEVLADLRVFITGLNLFKSSSVDELIDGMLSRDTSIEHMSRGFVIRLDY